MVERPEDPAEELPVPGVCSIDHTADIGIEIEAGSLSELFTRAALGTMWMVSETSGGKGSEPRRLRLSAPDLPSLLQRWLQEILYWSQVDGFSPAAIHVEELDAGDGDPGTEEGGGAARIDAELTGGPESRDPVREIKGVTLHGLVVERRAPGWFARVIFDV